MRFFDVFMKTDNSIYINAIGLLTCSFLIVIAYQDTFLWMYGRYVSPDSYYSHGFIVPFVSIVLIWQIRDKLVGLPQQKNLLGLCLIVSALFLHILGTALYVFSISGFSLIILIAGLVLYVFGKDIATKIIFPITFLVFMVPFPEAFISFVAFPLKMMVAKAGSSIAMMWGVPNIQEGFIITIPAGTLLVGNPCSGLRSLISFLAIGSVFSYLCELDKWKKWLLFGFSVPIALLSNLLRVPILISVSHYWSLETAAPETVVHTGSGVLVFIFGLLLLFLCCKVLK